MDEDIKSVEMTSKQELIHNVAKGVLAVAVGILTKAAVERAYDKVIVEPRYGVEVQTD